MATPISLVSLTFVLCVFLVLLCPFCSLIKGHTVEGNESTKSYFRTVKFSSLLPSNICKQSTKVLNKASSLKVVSKYGPCMDKTGDQKASNVPSMAEILLQDKLRVKSIQARLSMNPSSTSVFKEMQTKIPASEVSTGGAYVVTVGLGTPKREFTLLFDTGSDLTWAQCEPCSAGCFPQNQPKFDPTKSISFKNVSCSSTSCNLMSQEGRVEDCSSSSACNYAISYGSGFSNGFLATETLTITTSDVFENFVFGCGEQNNGTFDGTNGLLGLGLLEGIALPSQTTNKYKKIFSYCLPSSSSSTGYLSFGDDVSQAAKFTPTSDIKNFYGLDVVGISVGGRKLPIDASTFTTTKTIIDSGTTFTSLPSKAYSALSSAFQEMMTAYPLIEAPSDLQPCYDFSNYSGGNFTLPKISIFFKGGVEVEIDDSGVLIPVKGMTMCLAFEGSDEGLAVFGNYQQKTYEVVYDVAKGMVGFAPGGCS